MPRARSKKNLGPKAGVTTTIRGVSHSYVARTKKAQSERSGYGKFQKKSQGKSTADESPAAYVPLTPAQPRRRTQKPTTKPIAAYRGKPHAFIVGSGEERKVKKAPILPPIVWNEALGAYERFRQVHTFTHLTQRGLKITMMEFARWVSIIYSHPIVSYKRAGNNVEDFLIKRLPEQDEIYSAFDKFIRNFLSVNDQDFYIEAWDAIINPRSVYGITVYNRISAISRTPPADVLSAAREAAGVPTTKSGWRRKFRSSA